MIRSDFFELMAILVRARTPMVEALRLCKEELHGQQLSEAIVALLDAVEKGESLHEVTSQYPDLFPPPIPVYFRAGEQNGTMLEALEMLAAGIASGEFPDPREQSIMGGLRRFTFSAGMLLRLGMPYGEAIRSIAEAEPNEKVRGTVEDLARSVEERGSIGPAMARHTYIFSPAFTDLIARTETNGQLDTVFLTVSAAMNKKLFLPPI